MSLIIDKKLRDKAKAKLKKEHRTLTEFVFTKLKEYVSERN